MSCPPADDKNLSACQKAFADYIANKLLTSSCQVDTSSGLGVTELGCIKNAAGDIVGKAVLCKTYINTKTLKAGNNGACCCTPEEEEVYVEKIIAYFENGSKADPYTGAWEVCEDSGKASHLLEPLCDVVGTVSTEFFRHVITDNLGVTTHKDTKLDGTSPYVTSGVVGLCKEVPPKDPESLLLTDNKTDGSSVPFIRHYIYNPDGSVASTRDTLLDGTTPYVVSSGGTTGDSSASSVDVEGFVLCDTSPAGVPTTFVRKISYNSFGGVKSVTDTALDGQTPYTVTGTVDVCGKDASLQSFVLCDLLADGSVVDFIRNIFYKADGSVEKVEDLQTDGSAPYVVAGTVRDCTVAALSSNVQDVESQVLCDTPVAGGSPIVFVRHTQYGEDGTVSSVLDTTLDGSTTYSVVGTVGQCEGSHLQCTVLCDLQTNGQSVQFSRHVRYFADGTLQESSDTLLDNVTPYTVTGTVVSCEDLQVGSFVLCDAQAGGTSVQFIRHMFYSPNGSVRSVVDTALDGSTPYAITGTVTNCQDAQVSSFVLCDLQTNGDIVEFVRHMSYAQNGSVATVIDTALDGSTLYAVTGEVKDCGVAAENKDVKDPELLVLCDESGTFLRKYNYGEDGQSPTVLDTLLDGTTPYTTVGAVSSCESAKSDVENVLLCDTVVNGNVTTVNQFIRHVIYNDDGTVASTYDTDVSTSSPYTAQGTVGLCVEENKEADSKVLCWRAAAGELPTTFLRHYVYDDQGNVERMYDTTLDGSATFDASTGLVDLCGDSTITGETVCAYVTLNGEGEYRKVIPVRSQFDSGECVTRWVTPVTLCDLVADSVRPISNIVSGESAGTFGTQPVGTPGARDLENPPAAPYSYNDGTDVTPAEGSYAVWSGPPQAWHDAGFLNPTLRGHTTGADDDAYLIVNGATSIGRFFQEEFQVPPNTNVRLSFWTARWAPVAENVSMALRLEVTPLGGGPALAQADSQPIGNELNWRETSTRFNTGNNTDILMTLENITTAFGGNEIVLDDILVEIIGNPCEIGTNTERVIPDRLIDTGPGVVEANAHSVTFSNIGTGNATIRGVILPAGRSVTYTGYFDNAASQFNRIGEITYDATGTQLMIDVTP